MWGLLRLAPIINFVDFIFGCYERIDAFVGTPTILRADRGTENSIIAFVQPTLRNQHTDVFVAEKSLRKSSSNQVYTAAYDANKHYTVELID